MTFAVCYSVKVISQDTLGESVELHHTGISTDQKIRGLALNALELDRSQSDDCPMRNKDSCRSKTSSELSRQSEGAK